MNTGRYLNPALPFCYGLWFRGWHSFWLRVAFRQWGQCGAGGVGFGGHGYLWPWQPADLVERLHADPYLAADERICRATFPVSAASGSALRQWWRKRRLRAAREALGDYWPFSADIPTDWAWSIGETG